jgi:steroid 5-alpha reductase family enzyme
MALLFLLMASALGLMLVMTAAWAIALATGRSGFVDTIWSFSVGAFGAILALIPLPYSGPSTRQVIVAALAAFWSLRLGTHILQRTLKGGDDPRYAQLRAEWGQDYRRRLFWFLQIQAAAALPLVLTIAAAGHRPGAELGLRDALGIAVLFIAIVGESLADWQLKNFRNNPAHKDGVCDVGLWGLSRHPNFFFEWVGWIAYPIIAIEWNGSYPEGWIALTGPILIYWLLVHVSGIPPLEAHMLRSRPDAFKAYQSRVNAFWPGPARPLSKQHSS